MRCTPPRVRELDFQRVFHLGGFAFLFEGMRMERLAGTTVLTGNVIDQAHLVGLIQRTQELGLELVSIGPADERTHNPRTPRPGGNERDLKDLGK